MGHVLEQPATMLTIKGIFKAGDTMRFVPINELCTYGTIQNENVDRQTFSLTAGESNTVGVQLQNNIEYDICAREVGGDWAKQDGIVNARFYADSGATYDNWDGRSTTGFYTGKNVWHHKADLFGCPPNFQKDETDGLCYKIPTGSD